MLQKSYHVILTLFTQSKRLAQRYRQHLACRALVQAQRECLRGGPARAQPAAEHPGAVGLRQLQAGLRAAQVVQQRGRRVARLQGTKAPALIDKRKDVGLDDPLP